MSDFLVFGGAPGSNVMTQAAYAALAARTAGFSSGVAKSQELNKVWRQSSIASAVLAQFIEDITGVSSVDDGTTATLLANLKKAVSADSVGATGTLVRAYMPVGVASTTAQFNASEIIASNPSGLVYRLRNFSQTINLATVGVNGMDTGLAPISGYVGIYAIHNPTTGAVGLLAVDATAAAPSMIYSGGSMPAGYTASALVSIWGTNASRQFVIGQQIGREIVIQAATTFSFSAVQASLTPFSIAGAVPKGALSCRGDFSLIVNTANAVANLVVTPANFEVGRVPMNIAIPVVGVAQVIPIPPILIFTDQTLYYRSGVSAGTINGSVSITAYTI